MLLQALTAFASFPREAWDSYCLLCTNSGRVGGGKVSVKLTVTTLDFSSQGGETIPWELDLAQRSTALLSFPDLIYVQGRELVESLGS